LSKKQGGRTWKRKKTLVRIPETNKGRTLRKVGSGEGILDDWGYESERVLAYV